MSEANGARAGIAMRRIVARLLFAAVLLADAVLGAQVVRLYYLHPRTDDAYVRANIVDVAPQVSGTIIALPLRDDQHVRAGDLLFAIDPRPYQAELDLAQARLALTNLQIEALDRAIGAARARARAAQAEADYQRQYLARLVPLEKEEYVTANKVADVRSRLAAARAAVDQARNEVGQAQKQLGQLGDINARRAEAEARVYKAKLNVGYCEVRAQFDGYVTNLNTTIGQYANAGHAVLSLVDNRKWYVIANFRETFLSHIAPGMTARVYLLGYPNHRFRGVVEGVGWALYQSNGATMSGLANVAPTLNWVRLAQRFPVRITLEGADPAFPFRMGATAVVTIDGAPASAAGRGFPLHSQTH
ncbi:MAG TPA: HlyD family secretion protein [Candidatus Binataceae bacterium]|nr:HlyD family secretion protein [Candidatus Binataceae bacterium]